MFHRKYNRIYWFTKRVSKHWKNFYLAVSYFLNNHNIQIMNNKIVVCIVINCRSSTQCPYNKMFIKKRMSLKIDPKNREMANCLMCMLHCILYSKLHSVIRGRVEGTFSCLMKMIKFFLFLWAICGDTKWPIRKVRIAGTA